MAVITDCSEPPDRPETNDRVELLQKLSERLMMQDHDAEGDDFASEQISGVGAFNAPLTKLLQCHNTLYKAFQKIISECALQLCARDLCARDAQALTTVHLIERVNTDF